MKWKNTSPPGCSLCMLRTAPGSKQRSCPSYWGKFPSGFKHNQIQRNKMYRMA